MFRIRPLFTETESGYGSSHFDESGFGIQAVAESGSRPRFSYQRNIFDQKRNISLFKPLQNTFKLQKNPSAQQRTLQTRSFFIFSFFLGQVWLARIRIPYPDSDPLSHLSPDAHSNKSKKLLVLLILALFSKLLNFYGKRSRNGSRNDKNNFYKRVIELYQIRFSLFCIFFCRHALNCSWKLLPRRSCSAPRVGWCMVPGTVLTKSESQF